MNSTLHQLQIERDRMKLIQIQRARHQREFQVLRDTAYGYQDKQVAQIIQDNWETDQELVNI